MPSRAHRWPTSVAVAAAYRRLRHAEQRNGPQNRFSAQEEPTLRLIAIGVPPVHDLAAAAALFRSLGHPLRLQIMLALEHEPLSPTNLAQQLGAALGVIAYHARTLRAAGVIELDHTRPVRGSLQSYYRLSERGHTALQLLAIARRN